MYILYLITQVKVQAKILKFLIIMIVIKVNITCTWLTTHLEALLIVRIIIIIMIILIIIIIITNNDNNNNY